MTPVTPPDFDALDVAARWRLAVETNDMTTLRSLYRVDAKIWTNLKRTTHELEEHIGRITRSRSKASSWEYRDVRCQRTDTGFVSEHTVRVHVDGQIFELVAAIIGTLEDGYIMHLTEYLENPRRVGLG